MTINFIRSDTFVILQQKVGSRQTRAMIRKSDVHALKLQVEGEQIALIDFIIDGHEADEQVEHIPVPVKLLPPALVQKNEVGVQFLLFNLKQLRERALQVKVG